MGNEKGYDLWSVAEPSQKKRDRARSLISRKVTNIINRSISIDAWMSRVYLTG